MRETQHYNTLHNSNTSVSLHNTTQCILRAHTAGTPISNLTMWVARTPLTSTTTPSCAPAPRHKHTISQPHTLALPRAHQHLARAFIAAQQFYGPASQDSRPWEWPSTTYTAKLPSTRARKQGAPAPSLKPKQRRNNKQACILVKKAQSPSWRILVDT